MNELEGGKTRERADGLTLELDVSEYLATLPDQERAQAQKRINAATLAQLPDDEVGKPPVRNLRDYLDAEIELPPELVKPFVMARGAITAMTARGGKGKTTVNLNRMLRWSMGLPLFDDSPDLLAPVQPLRVLVIENEGAAGHFQKVLADILHAKGNAFTDEQKELAYENFLVWGDGGWSGLKLDDAENYALVDRACRTHKPDIVFIEPMRGLWTGDENSATEMAVLMDRLNGLANIHNCGVMVTHHEKKGSLESGQDQMDAARGSGVITDLAAVVERWVPVQGDKQRELKWTKNRYNPFPPAPIRMEFDIERWGYRLVQEDESLRDFIQIMQTLPDQWWTINALAEESGETYQTSRRRAMKLVEAGRAKKKSLGQGEGIGFRLVTTNGDDEEGLALT